MKRRKSYIYIYIVGVLVCDSVGEGVPSLDCQEELSPVPLTFDSCGSSRRNCVQK